MEKKKTAVEWLINELKSLGIYSSTLKEKCEKSKEMEKEQIIDAFKRGTINEMNGIEEINSEQYYKTFKQD